MIWVGSVFGGDDAVMVVVVRGGQFPVVGGLIASIPTCGCRLARGRQGQGGARWVWARARKIGR